MYLVYHSIFLQQASIQNWTAAMDLILLSRDNRHLALSKENHCCIFSEIIIKTRKTDAIFIYLVYHCTFRFDFYQLNCIAGLFPNLLSLDCMFRALHRKRKKDTYKINKNGSVYNVVIVNRETKIFVFFFKNSRQGF